MIFSSLTFIFFFLPIFFLIYFISSEKYKNLIILLFSLFFYAWGEPKYVILMILSIIINYTLALLIEKHDKIKKLLLILTIILNISVLFIFKYCNFAILNINKYFNTDLKLLKLALPIGISFYTFQALSYVVDVYRKDVKAQKNIISLGAYIALFPQLIAGPIVRYSTINKQLSKRKITLEKFSDGIRRFIIGLGKKVIIANNIAIVADMIFDGNISEYGFLILIMGALAYTFQIYFDFSGYSDMAIGLGKMLGFDFLENFNYPYVSTSITDFWRRWHISLSSWFRDYVYIPLGGNRTTKLKWIRNILIVWCLTGLWHGASWNFVLWGLYFAIILLFEKIIFNKVLEKIPNFICWIYSFCLICFGWIIFRLEYLSDIIVVFKNIFTLKNYSLLDFFAENYKILNYLPYFIPAIICSLPVFDNIYKKYKDKNILIKYITDFVIIGIFCLSVCFLIQSTYNPFIYFRF